MSCWFVYNLAVLSLGAMGWSVVCSGCFYFDSHLAGSRRPTALFVVLLLVKMLCWFVHILAVLYLGAMGWSVVCGCGISSSFFTRFSQTIASQLQCLMENLRMNCILIFCVVINMGLFAQLLYV